MNVYVRELGSALAQAGIDSTVFVRRWAAGLPDSVDVEPGFRVVHVDAGPHVLPKASLPGVVGDFRAGVKRYVLDRGGVDAIHANYWLSGIAAHELKHDLELPLVSTFHTLARVKAETGDPEPGRREHAEAEVMGCSDVILASCLTEAEQLRRLYGVAADRIEIVAPGVDHAFFSPGDRAGARAALGLGREPVLLFAGRIQPLKGLGVAIRALAELRRSDAKLLVVGGPSGADGQREMDKAHVLVGELGLGDRVMFEPPQPHHRLSSFYRAADVCLVPSRSESFGLVALEAAACGTPVVAAAVGGLTTLVEPGLTGALVDSREPEAFARAIEPIIGDADRLAEMGRASARRARGYTWSTTAGRLRRVYADLAAREPVVAC